MAETVTTDAEGDFTTSVPVPSSLTVSGDYDVTASGDNALNQSTSASTAILVGFDNTAPILTGFGSSQQMTVSPPRSMVPPAHTVNGHVRRHR